MNKILFIQILFILNQIINNVESDEDFTVICQTEPHLCGSNSRESSQEQNQINQKRSQDDEITEKFQELKERFMKNKMHLAKNDFKKPCVGNWLEKAVKCSNMVEGVYIGKK